MSTTNKKRKPKVKLTPTNKVALNLTYNEVVCLKAFLESLFDTFEGNNIYGVLDISKARNLVFSDALTALYRKNFTKLSLPERENKFSISIGQAAAIWIFYNRIVKEFQNQMLDTLTEVMEGIHQKLS
jgi:hypothetical protein